jgi:hypothetical protein
MIYIITRSNTHSTIIYALPSAVNIANGIVRKRPPWNHAQKGAQTTNPAHLISCAKHVSPFLTASSPMPIRWHRDCTKTPRNEFVHESQVSTLFESARKGCHLCSIFTSLMRPLPQILKDIGEDHKVRVSTCYYAPVNFRYLNCVDFCLEISCDVEVWRTNVHRHIKKGHREIMPDNCMSALEREGE